MKKRFNRKKISLIGAGNIGGNLALMAAQKGLGDVVLFDVVPGLPQGKALDIMQSFAAQNIHTQVSGTNDYKDIDGSDIVIITAGKPRLPGMSRDDLLDINAKIMKDVALNVKKHAPDSVVIVISNPLDAMVYQFAMISGFEKNKVVGMSGILDSSRLRTFISMETGVSPYDIRTFVLGGHGDDMVPLIRYTYVGGIPLLDFPGITKEKVDKMVERTRNGGAEIVNLLKTGSAFYAPAVGAITMAESILSDQRRIFSAAAFVNGEYGHKDIFICIPVILGGNGVEKVIEINLNPDEKKALDKSAHSVESSKEIMTKKGYLT
ncbi:MAG: malate dehydrogenase [Spirochaetia bacterium]|nr:malate dehydrogenase [Spirochaetia bacterium]